MFGLQLPLTYKRYNKVRGTYLLKKSSLVCYHCVSLYSAYICIYVHESAYDHTITIGRLKNCLDTHLAQIVCDKDEVVDWCIVPVKMPPTRFEECWPLPTESHPELPENLNIVTLTLWPINPGVLTSLLLPHLSSSLTDSLLSLNLLCFSKTDARFMQDGQKAVWSIPCVSVAFFPSLKQNFIGYRSSKVSSRPDCIFEIHQLWQSGFSRVYSNCCCSCSFEPEIIKIGQSSHKMNSNNTLNFQESTAIFNACTKTAWKHIECTTYIYLDRETLNISKNPWQKLWN